MKVALIGAVKSSEIILRILVKFGFNIVGVLGHDPLNKENVSGWTDLALVCEELGLPFQAYQRINEKIHQDWVKEKSPDILFAVGFSQLLSNEWLNLPNLGCIGFHPTYLPRGRGRAPLAWLILEEKKGAATFFLMGEGADDGPVFIQQPFEVLPSDDAASLVEKIYIAIEQALSVWLPRLKNGEWNPIPQNELEATWYGKRMPSDGIIDWNRSAEEIDRLIKASTTPHPGAFTFFNDEKIIIFKSSVEKNIPIKGVTGRVLLCRNNCFLVQCGNGLLWIEEMKDDFSLKVGDKLGYYTELEIYKLKTRK